MSYCIVYQRFFLKTKSQILQVKQKLIRYFVTRDASRNGPVSNNKALGEKFSVSNSLVCPWRSLLRGNDMKTSVESELLAGWATIRRSTRLISSVPGKLERKISRKTAKAIGIICFMATSTIRYLFSIHRVRTALPYFMSLKF